jgi:internalin A
MGPTSRPWRTFIRFSVRGLVVVVLVIGGWLGWIVRSVRIEREAVAAVKRAGGGVVYDWEWSNHNYRPGIKPQGPIWLQDLIGLDDLGHVALVELPSDGPHEAMAQVGRLSHLTHLHLCRSSVRDAELVHLRGLTNLSYLCLNYTMISDSGLVHLKGLSNLSVLNLSSTHITDAGLDHLKGLTNLSTLYLEKTEVTHEGVKELKQTLPKLAIIYFR